MGDVCAWFKEVFMYRTFAAVAWTVFLQPLFLCVAVLLLEVDLVHPFQWATKSLHNFFVPSAWLYNLLLAGTLAGFGLLHAKSFTVSAQVFGSRFSLLCTILSPYKLVLLFIHILLGGLMMRCYIGVVGGTYSRLTRPCTINSFSWCVHEQHIFLVLCGCFLGVCHFLWYYLQNGSYLAFPIVQQQKFLQLKMQCGKLLRKAAVAALHQLKWYYILYFIWGGTVKAEVCSVLGLQTLTSPLDSILGLLDVHLFLTTWVYSTLFIFILSVLLYLFKIYNTEYYAFPLESAFPTDQNLRLQKALQAKDFSLLQYLAFLDLATIAEKNSQKRQEVFSVSQPGGHPHNWNTISTECLSVIKNFTTELCGINNIDSSPVPAAEAVLSEAQPAVSSQTQVRNLTSLYEQLGARKGEPEKRQAPIKVTEMVLSCVKKKLQQVWANLKKKPGFSYLFGDHPETKSRQLFCISQLLIWAVEALSHLVAASFSEDKFGVVQKQMPDVVTALLDLQQNLEKHQILGNTVYRRPQKEREISRDFQLKNALKSTVKAAIYRICVKFGKHISDINVSSEHHHRLLKYLQFNEG